MIILIKGIINLYSKEYNLKERNILINFKNKMNNILYFSYRTNFYNIQNLKNYNIYNSDCGWGCMIRSGQMILARGIYKYFKKLNPLNKNRKFEILIDTLFLFLDNPISLQINFPPILNTFKQFIFNFKNFSYSEGFRNVQQIIPPFSLKSICNVGKIVNKYAGEWFSDVSMSNIFEKIINNYEIFKDEENNNILKFFTFQNSIDLKKVLETCFVKQNNYQSNIDMNNKQNKIFNHNNISYEFKNSGIIFVSCRLGLNQVESCYFEPLLFLFQSKNCLGFIGGKPGRAFYFIGFDHEQNLVYLDPHLTQESINTCISNSKQIESYFVKNIYRIKINNIQPSLTIGFIFRNVLEFNALINFLEINNNFTEKFFSYSFKTENKNTNSNNDNKDIIIDIKNSNKDDF